MQIPDGLAALISALAEDRDMRTWFVNLSRLPDNLCTSAIGRLVAQMSADGEDRDAVDAFSALGDATTRRAVARVLHERYGVGFPEK